MGERKTSEIRDISLRDLPCWYELSWIESGPTLVLRIHEDFIENAYQMTPNSPIIRALAQDLDLGNFSGDFQGHIGFEEALKNQGKKDGFTEFALAVPQIKRITDQECQWCGGSGQDDLRDWECLRCEGSGKGYEMDWHQAYTASASLTAFTVLLRLSEKDTSTLFPQLLTFQTITQKDMHGGSLGAEVSFPLRQWLSRYAGSNTLPEVTRAMMATYDQMFGLKDLDEYCFQMIIREDGALMMDCPGNASGLHPDHQAINGIDRGYGYELACHNVDSPAQQLTLLAGLAALHDKARKEI
ncbi:MAG: hypothetical protein Q7S44_00355 [bacterium]|nr:hypothetical protein [bacterium]